MRSWPQRSPAAQRPGEPGWRTEQLPRVGFLLPSGLGAPPPCPRMGLGLPSLHPPPPRSSLDIAVPQEESLDCPGQDVLNLETCWWQQ